MYAYIHIRIRIHIHIHRHIYVDVYILIIICIFIYSQLGFAFPITHLENNFALGALQVLDDLQMYACINMRIRIHVHIHIHRHIYVDVYILIFVYSQLHFAFPITNLEKDLALGALRVLDHLQMTRGGIR